MNITDILLDLRNFVDEKRSHDELDLNGIIDEIDNKLKEVNGR